jgi:hypothetical protein
MTATIKTDLVGVRQAVASLNKIEPGLRKQFALELNQIAAAGNTSCTATLHSVRRAVVRYARPNGQTMAAANFPISTQSR